MITLKVTQNQCCTLSLKIHFWKILSGERQIERPSFLVLTISKQIWAVESSIMIL